MVKKFVKMKKIRQHSRLVPGMWTLCDHEEGAIDVIHSIVKQYEPELIIEFGTWMGGVTLTLHEAAPNAILYSFDNRKMTAPYGSKFYVDIVTTEYLEVFNKLCFNDNVFFIVNSLHKKTKALNELAVQLCQFKCRKVLYCDNGDKVREVNNYGSCLNAGDLLGVHDWPRQVNREKARMDDFADHPCNKKFAKNKFRTRFFYKIR